MTDSATSNDQPDPPAGAKGRPWVFPVLLGVVLACVALWRWAPPPDTGEPGPAPAAEGQVRLQLEIEGDPGAELVVPPTGGAVLSVLRAAGERSERFAPTVIGAGASAFVDAIGGIANEGMGGRNWTYEVNGDPGDRSAAIAPVQDGDHILWKFAPAE